jgi:hypothetical protein
VFDHDAARANYSKREKPIKVDTMPSGKDLDLQKFKMKPLT